MRYFLVYTVSLLLSVVCTVMGGQDVNFDLTTYHYFLGYSAFTDRLALDYLPASFQGYQSPLPYTLLYWLDSVGVYPVFNASIHAAIHALNLLLLFAIAEILAGDAATRRARIAVGCFWLLGAIAPVYWRLVGTSFSDLMTSVPVLAGVWLVARSINVSSVAGTTSSGRVPMVLGALLVGLAAGMRLHNAIYVVALLLAIVFVMPRGGSRGVGYLATALFAMTVGGLLSFAPWGLRVYKEFGNPVFPLFNGIFRSPDFPAANLPLTSFVPSGAAEWLAFPWRIAGNLDWVYIESRLPDVRPALLALLLGAACIVWVARRMCAGAAIADFRLEGRDDAILDHGARLVIVFFIVSALLWLLSSSNGRYGVVLFMLGGPLCGVLLLHLLPMRYLIVVTAGVLLWQGLLIDIFYRQIRPTAMPWTARYFDWDAPAYLKQGPVTLLSFGFQTASTLAPHMHPGSSHVNIVGQYVPNAAAPGSKRIEDIIGRTGQKIYGAFDYQYTRQDLPGASSVRTYFKDHLLSWGLQISAKTCYLSTFRPAHESMAGLNNFTGAGRRFRSPRLIICELLPVAVHQRVVATEQFAAFSANLAAFGKDCPRLFGRPLSYLRTPDRWIVSSFASLEVTLYVPDNGPMMLQMMRPPYVNLAVGEASPSKLASPQRDCNLWFSDLWALAKETIDAKALLPK